MGLSTFTSKEFGPFFVGALWLIGAGTFTVHVLYQAPLRSYETTYGQDWSKVASRGIEQLGAHRSYQTHHLRVALWLFNGSLCKITIFQYTDAPWCWHIYLQNWVILRARANVGVHISAPWFPYGINS